MRLRDLIFVSVVLGGGLALARGTLRPPASTPPREPAKQTGQADLRPIVAEINTVFERRWTEKGARPAAPASELAVLRRLVAGPHRFDPRARGDPPVRGPAGRGPN